MKPCSPPSVSTTSAPGPEHQVVGVAEHDLDAEVLEVRRRQRPHRAPGADRHEARHREPAPRRGRPRPARAAPSAASTSTVSFTRPAPTGGRAASRRRRRGSGSPRPARCRRAAPAGPDEGVDQREERRPGHVEVGEQPVDHPELEVAVDEQVGPARRTRRAAADSSARTTVVPTATTRSRGSAPLAARRRARRSASACMGWSSTRSAVMGRNVPSPTTSSTAADLGTPRPGRRRAARSVRCSPAVGAATEPARRAYTVW